MLKKKKFPSKSFFTIIKNIFKIIHLTFLINNFILPNPFRKQNGGRNEYTVKYFNDENFFFVFITPIIIGNFLRNYVFCE